MIKRITAMIIAVIIPIALLSGCGKSLTVEEYKDELQSKWRDYASAQMAIVSDMQSFDESGTIPAEFEDHCKSFEQAMKAFEKINPPSDYKEKHKQLVKALDNERDWLAAIRECAAATSPQEIEQAEQKIQAAANYPNSVPKIILELFTKLVEELGYE